MKLTWPLKNGGWETTFLLGFGLFSSAILVSGRVVLEVILNQQLHDFFVSQIFGRPTMTDFYPYAKAVTNQLNSLATVRGMYFSSGDPGFDRCVDVDHPNLSNESKRRGCLLFTQKK